MSAIVKTAEEIEKVMEFLVEAGFTPETIKHFKPINEDRNIKVRRERMWGIIQNVLRRALREGHTLTRKSMTYS